jgi:hypothetical protein
MSRITSDYHSAPACCKDIAQGIIERNINLTAYDAAKIEYYGKYMQLGVLRVYYYIASNTVFFSDLLTESWTLYSHAGLPVNATKIRISDGGTGKLLFDDFSVIADKKPALDTGTVSPSTGMPGTSYCWSAKYTDTDNDPPASGYSKLHILKSGADIPGSPFPMSSADGKTITYSRLLSGGTDYSYYFEASDGWLSAASAVYYGPCNDTPPMLSWTGEPGYESSGLNYIAGSTSTIFTFRIAYTDAENGLPLGGAPKLHVKNGGTEIPQSPFLMDEANPGDFIFSDGKIYTCSLLLPLGADYSFYFDAADPYSLTARTAEAPGPIVTANPLPMLERGHPAFFVSVYKEERPRFSVKYYDFYNAMPSSGYPAVNYWNQYDRAVSTLTLDLAGASGTGWAYGKTVFLLPGVYFYRYAVRNSRCPDEYCLSLSSFAVANRPTDPENALSGARPLANGRITLKWKSSDPDGGGLSYRVYLGPDQYSMDLVYEGEEPFCDIDALGYGTNYAWKVEAVNRFGVSSMSRLFTFSTISKPAKAYNFPNPFNPARGGTAFVFNMAENGAAEINVLSELGDLCWRKRFENLPAGANQVSYDGRDEAGGILYNGSYYCVILKKYPGREEKDSCRILVVK